MRENNTSGFALWFYQYSGTNYARPHVFSKGKTAAVGAGGGVRYPASSTGPVSMTLNTWNHCAWVMRWTSATTHTLEIYLNGQSCGTMSDL